MKRLTIEEAECSPQRLKMIMRDKLKTNEVKANEVRMIGYRYHYYSIPYSRIIRFIASYIGKSWNLCYSDYLHWLKSERRLNHGRYRANMKDWFHDQFYSKTWRTSPYMIDSEGLIQINPEKTRYRAPKHSASLYKLEPNKHIKEIFRKAGKLHLYNQLLEGVPREALVTNFQVSTHSLNSLGKQICYCLNIEGTYFYHLYGAFTHFYKPIEHTKKEWKQMHYEKLSKQRKQEREEERHKKEMLEQDLHRLFWYADRAKEARIRKQRELERAEELLNIITRDRLGFDETSFKTFR